AADPNKVMVEGQDRPAELLYSQWMTTALASFAPEASEALRLAARAYHIRRWTIPRGSYARGRLGYLQWRTALASLHAKQASKILREAGYDVAMSIRVESLIRKERLKADPETQTLEDVICLVFLKHELGDFARKHPEEKVLTILQKTWKKM